MMISVAGELEAGEAQGTMPSIADRQRGSRYGYQGALVVLVVLGAVLGALVSYAFDRMNPNMGGVSSTLMPLGVAGGAMVYLWLCRPFLVKRFRRRMTDRGLPTRFRYETTVTDDGLIQQCGGVHRVATWTSVTEVFKSKAYWVFLVQMEPWFAPTRFFASAADEKAFLNAAFAHMSQDALARSREAVAFAKS